MYSVLRYLLSTSGSVSSEWQYYILNKLAETKILLDPWHGRFKKKETEKAYRNLTEPLGSSQGPAASDQISGWQSPPLLCREVGKR